MPKRTIPEAAVARLPVYLRALLDLVGEDGDDARVSSEQLASLAGVNAAKVRKDLSYLGTYGTRGVGYDAKQLLYEITRELGLTQDWPTAIVGIGNLGRALASYKGFAERGFRIVTLFDVSDEAIGREVAGLEVRHLDDLKEATVTEGLCIGIIATPPSAAQEVADHLVDAGIKSILNFAPAVISAPPDVQVRQVDLSIELQILSFYQRRTGAIEAAREAAQYLRNGE